MNRERTAFLVGLAVALGVVAVLILWPKVKHELGPKPVAAWLAVGIGDATPRVGRVEIAAGEPFRLYAVLEARQRGETLYFTEAPGLVIEDRAVPAERIRRRGGDGDIVKVLWFTVEGVVPYLRLKPDGGLGKFRFEDFFRADWPRTWTVDGVLEPAHDDQLATTDTRADVPFGTQRFHVRIEQYDPDRPLVPVARYSSWDAEDLEAHLERFPTVVATLPSPLRDVSRVFGLTQLEPPPEAPRELLEEIGRLTREGLAFSRLYVLRQHLAAAGVSLEGLEWREIDLEGGTRRWGDEVRAGDLLRVGGRVVVLYEDAGEEGVLDPGDRCFDFTTGALVMPLSDVFGGEGLVEWAPLPRP